MSKTRTLLSVAALFALFSSLISSAMAQPVVVVPLGKKATGNAIEADVSSGKTFSSENGYGLIGTLVIDPQSTGNATAGDVLSGKTFSNASAVGLSGTRPIAPVAQTGEAGSSGVAWPNPRLTDNSNGTVTDNLTGLVWLEDANCAAGTADHAGALAYVSELNASGTMNGNDCGDLTGAADWRLPSINDYASLRDISQTGPALPGGNTYFDNVQSGASDHYWSASSPVNIVNAFFIQFQIGQVGINPKTATKFTWAVRGGQ